ncbi:MAG TPA: sugar ABC transporter permease [Steroidobacteraceae bacterium]|nr:sugar ABC transporter permease [Steroidobacteraceae bacterium]
MKRTPASESHQANEAGWWLSAPALLIIGGFFLVPVIAAFLLSFTDFDLYALADYRNLRVVGLQNYATLFTTPLFWKALGNTALFVVLGVPLSLLASLGTALLIDSRLARFKPFFRTALFAPVVTTLVAVALIWRYLLHTRYGLINHGLAHFGIPPIDWLGDPHWSMPAIVLLAVWKNFGYNMIILIAALQAIPEDLYEAARLEGAGAWAQLRHITLPLLVPTLGFVGILTVSGYFQLFAEPYVMTQGGPLQSTVSVLYYMFDQGFTWWRLGFASSVAFVLFALVLALTALQIRLMRAASSP